MNQRPKIQYLSRYQKLKYKYDFLQNRIYNIKAISYGEKEGAGHPKTQIELIQERDEVEQEMHDIIDTIKTSDLDEYEYMVLIAKYIDGLSFNQIQMRGIVPYSRSMIFEIRNKALNKLKIK